MTPVADRIIDAIIAREGGVSDHPNDHGGLTKFGITLSFAEWVLDRVVTPHEITSMTEGMARQIYAIWLQRTRLSDLCEWPDTAIMAHRREKLANIIVDWAVQRGHTKAIKLLQTVLGFAAGDIDGVIGPQTIGALTDQAIESGQLIERIIKARVHHRALTVRREPDQAVFLVGWLDRDMSFL